MDAEGVRMEEIKFDSAIVYSELFDCEKILLGPLLIKIEIGVQGLRTAHIYPLDQSQWNVVEKRKA